MPGCAAPLRFGSSRDYSRQTLRVPCWGSNPSHPADWQYALPVELHGQQHLRHTWVSCQPLCRCLRFLRRCLRSASERRLTSRTRSRSGGSSGGNVGASHGAGPFGSPAGTFAHGGAGDGDSDDAAIPNPDNAAPSMATVANIDLPRIGGIITNFLSETDVDGPADWSSKEPPWHRPERAIRTPF